MQTVPSLALFGFLIPIPLIGGIGQRTAIVALVLYALLPMLRNTLAGILGVDAAVRESAVAMGMTGRQILWEVELPLASRTILAGIRVATVTTIGDGHDRGLHRRAAGWAYSSFAGLASVDSAQILAGAIPAACIALLAEGGLGWVERKCRRSDRVPAAAGRLRQAAGAIVVGSKNFTEQVILGEIVAQHLEQRLGVAVDRKLNLGGTLLAHQALVNGQIDMYPEYTGTALTAILKLPVFARCGRGAENRVRAEYRSQWNLEWLPSLGFNNTFAMVIGGGGSQIDLSQAAGRKPGWKLGVGYEFLTRPDGLPGLLETYHLPLDGSPRSMDLGLLYQALKQKQVDMVAGNATDGLIAAMGLTVLRDDKNYFPPYEAALAVRGKPELRATLEELSGKISTVAMRNMNYEVDGKHRAVREVARDFLAGAMQ